MSVIKKKILQITTTGTTQDCSGDCRIIIPDLSVDYYLKFSLTQENNNLGFFDVYDFDDINDIQNNIDNYNVTGESKSRLSELRKYTITNNFSEMYKINGTYINDGVDMNTTVVGSKIVYYIGGIRFVDYIEDSVTYKTTFNFIGEGFNLSNFTNKPYYKDVNKENMIDNPKINNNVSVVRQELSAFENNYKLVHIERLVDLRTYASGKYFNVVEN